MTVMRSSSVSSLVPDWFRLAKEFGLPEKNIRREVRAFCAEAESYRVQEEGLPPPVDPPAEEWVELMHEMYEEAYQMSLKADSR